MNRSCRNICVSELFIFNDKFDIDEDSLSDKVLYFYPKSTSVNDLKTSVGLSEALLIFSRFFSSQCISLHSRQSRRYFHQISSHVWIVMTIVLSPAPVSEKSNDSELESVDDNVMLATLSRLCDLFELLHGPVNEKAPIAVQNTHRCSLVSFYDQALKTLDLTSCDILDCFNGILYKHLPIDGFFQVEHMMHRIEYSCTFAAKTAVFYDVELLWSSIPIEVVRLMFCFLRVSVIGIQPESENVSISPKARHMGRFLIGSPELTECSSSILAVPHIFLSNTPYRPSRLIAYRALRLTVCILVQNDQELPLSFYRSFDDSFGEALTKLALSLESPLVSNESTDSNRLAISPSAFGEGMVNSFQKRTGSLMDLQQISATSSVLSHTSSGAYLYWNSATFEVSSQLHALHNGSRICALPFAQPILALIAELREDFFSRSTYSSAEVAIKIEPDTWVLARRFNRQEIYISFTGKRFDLQAIMENARRIFSTEFYSFLVPD